MPAPAAEERRKGKPRTNDWLAVDRALVTDGLGGQICTAGRTVFVTGQSGEGLMVWQEPGSFDLGNET
jgi:hypothetical protein